MKKILLTLAALAVTSPALASVICAGCEYRENFAGTFLGVFNPGTADLATFQNSDIGIQSTARNFWVFDLAGDAIGSMSADFTLFASIGGFFGELFADDGSQCAGNQCQSVSIGASLGRASGQQWEIVDFLPAGRYVLMIGGTPNPINDGAYTGQMSFLALAIREPGTLAIFGLGLVALGFMVRRHRHR